MCSNPTQPPEDITASASLGFVDGLQPAPPLPPAPLVAECSLAELLEQGHIALVENWVTRWGKKDKPGWLQESFVKNKQHLVRRQDLPPDATLGPAEAVQQMNAHSVAVISHGWLAPRHPDPARKRRGDVDKIIHNYVFWDFLSLFQIFRSTDEEQSFRVGLASMHNVCGHRNWLVVRLLTVPWDARNDTAYFRTNYTDHYWPRTTQKRNL